MIALALSFVILHGVDGAEIVVNPAQVTSLRTAAEQHNKHFVEGARCLISLADGKFVTVQEQCVTVRTMIKQLQ